ncbi:hypothetical protein KJ780_00355 [Candidatus Micrarchaeota archaeon]|nr:hypothetical protein [Candidatus Micrarchaeota archaeon]
MAAKNNECAKISEVKLGISCGVLWGAGLLLVGLVAGDANYGAGFIGSIGSVYLGYGPGALGGLIGLLYGLADGFFAGFFIAWIYNRLNGM